ncbi:hypothetical protein [Salidesulfovibrio onnuriiensis]|uniref:hypothetical protein n=1 Tax=Salidesulfovibrio onnuriiensis TaxID=2583823 RepID=UPI00202B2233|nr:hypothetical protein [Salidesulfovibrio onnuriiensis]
MTTETLTAPCKINLYLEIRDVLDNGYHELLTLFLPVADPHDTLTVSTDCDRFRLECPGFPELETESNLVRKAWEAFGEATGRRPHYILYWTSASPWARDWAAAARTRRPC